MFGCDVDGSGCRSAHDYLFSFLTIMNTASIERLKKVHPLLQHAIGALVMNLAALGIEIEVVQGLRTFAEQDALFAQGRTKPGNIVTRARGGQSEHNYGVAVDVAPTRNGKIDWNDLPKFFTIGVEAKKVGLEWGGDWHKFIDKPHVQLPAPPIAQMLKLYSQGGLNAVWAAVNSVSVKQVAGVQL